MVVGQAPILYAPALPPVHFSTQMYSSLPVGAQGYQSPPVSSPTLPCAPITPPAQCIQPSSPILQHNSSGSPPLLTPITCNPVNGNAVFTYTPVPTNLYSGISVMPISTAATIPPKDSSPATVPYSPSLYTYTQSMSMPVSMPPTAIVPSQPRVITTTLLPCSTGLCQYSMPSEMPISSNINQIYNIPPPTMSLSLAQTVAQTNVVSPWKQSYGMEQVWRKEFSNLFFSYTQSINHVWTLLPVNEKPEGIWHENVDSAKVRFCCFVCGHGWTSMKGRVAFWFILNYATNEGVVCLKLYGQQCDRCKRGDYEPAMWYPEEVLKVMMNIYNKVGEIYYGFKQAPYHKTRRPGKPRTPHNSDLCQACKDGVCAERR